MAATVFDANDSNPGKDEGASNRNQKESGPSLFSVGYNSVHRDVKHINDAVNFNFDDVLAEPDSLHGPSPVWRMAHFTFVGSRLWLYWLLSSLVAFPLALCWGIVFALLTFVSVWLLSPIVRIIEVASFYIRRILVTVFQSTLEPCFMAIYSCVTNIKVTHIQQRIQTV